MLNTLMKSMIAAGALLFAACPAEPPAPLVELKSGELAFALTGGGGAWDACLHFAEAGDGTIIAACTTTGRAVWADGTPQEFTTTVPGQVLLGLSPRGELLWHVNIDKLGLLPGIRAEESVELGWVNGLATLSDGRVAALFSGAEGAESDVVVMVLNKHGYRTGIRHIAHGQLFGDMNWFIEPTHDGGMLVSGSFRGDLTVMPNFKERVLHAGEEYELVQLRLDEDLFLRGVGRISAAEKGSVYIGHAIPLEDGGMIVSGGFTGLLRLGEDKAVELRDPDGDVGQGFIASLYATGEPRWAIALGSEGEEAVTDIARAADGSVVAMGYWGLGAEASELSVYRHRGFEVARKQGRSDSDIFVLRIHEDGSPQWLEGFGSLEDDIALSGSIDVFEDGGVVVSAKTAFQMREPPMLQIPREYGVFFSDGERIDMGASNVGAVVARYGARGFRGWTHVLADTNPFGLRVLEDGSVMFGGCFANGAIFGAGELNEFAPAPRGGYDAMILRYAR